jgi:hypothetical protein
MDKRFTPAAQRIGQQAYDLLDALVDGKTNPAGYREAMTAIGGLLGDALSQTHELAGRNICAAFTVEDADYLAKGMIDAIQGAGAEVTVACFWNRRDQPFDVDWLDIAPIVQEYIEPSPPVVDHLVLLKSIISGACVVRTNLLRLLDEMKPLHIHVVSPVMLEGAPARLSRFMPEEVASRFEYLTFAIDTKKLDNGNVIPGIGGEVYDRLGLGDGISKNAVMPRLVEERLDAAV